MAAVVQQDLGQELNGPADCADGTEGVGCGWDVHDEVSNDLERQSYDRRKLKGNDYRLG